MKIRVLHAYYGCDTGCCGHILEIDGEEDYDTFEFDHFDYDFMGKTAKERLREFILSKIPEECHADIDWESVELDTYPC